MPHVLIIGAGIGGLTLAQCLRKKGISFEVFERDASPTARGQGYALGLYGPEALFGDALPSDLPPLQSTQHLHPLPLPSQVIYHFPNGKLFSLTDSPSTPCIRANRLRLRALLSTSVTIQFGKAATHIVEFPSSVTVHFADGTSASGDIVVGADGIHSAVRPHALGKPNDEVLQRWPAEIVCGEVKLCGKELEAHLRLGHSCFLAVMGFGSLFSGVDRVEVDEAMGETTVDCYWVLAVMNKTGEEPGSVTKRMDPAERLEWAKKKAREGGLNERLTLALDRTVPEGIQEHTVSFVRETFNVNGGWYDAEITELPPVNRVLLIGDAAHPMTPNRGEGGITAIKDAIRLAEVLAEVDGSDFEALRAELDRYQKEVVKNGLDVITKTREETAQLRTGKSTPKAWGNYTAEIKELPSLPVMLRKD